MKKKTIPFDLETAKKIQAGEIEGCIRTKNGDFTVRIICFDKIKLVNGDGATEKQIVSLIYNENAREEVMYVHNKKGEVQTQFVWEHGYDLVLEVPDNEPKFKPFDKVLVRNDKNSIWQPSIFSYQLGDRYYTVSSFPYEKENIIPYDGNQYLLGTTYKLKED